MAEEASVQAIGRSLIERSSRGRFSPSSWLNSKIMRYAMSDPKVKTQLFRLVDVLPSLSTSAQVADHVRQYLSIPETPFPLRAAAGMASTFPSVTAWAVNKGVHAMAKTFIAGSDHDEAHAVAMRLADSGIRSTFDLLGESVVSEVEADRYASKYESLFKTLRGRLPVQDTPEVNVSIKLTSLFSQLDPIDPKGSWEGVKGRLTKLADLAVEQDAFLNIDMEDYRVKELTLDIFKRLLMEDKYRYYPYFGIVLQAYLKDTERDLWDLALFAMRRGCRFSVRLVKGAYWDYEVANARMHGWKVPVFLRKCETDANYELCSRKLLEAQPHLGAAFGTHNVRSIANVIASADELKLNSRLYEFQGLYGMADELKQVLSQDDFRVRAYLPYGQILPGMAYLVRRLLENTANESFLRQSNHDQADVETLLRNPRHE
jgi:RHH-type transcriptional regulator, proline utilization regulon repressor / proline dehydrogenase / delta 1-pyrroline-5-carboxylate dehydrogenase